MKSQTRLSNCSPRGSTPSLFGQIKGITTEQGMVLGVQSLKQIQFSYLASQTACCLEQGTNWESVVYMWVRGGMQCLNAWLRASEQS